MSLNPLYDRWYAATHCTIVASPRKHLATFGTTSLNYHMLSELPDHPGKVRVREGHLEAHSPEVLRVGNVGLEVEGFGPEAQEYLEYIREHADEMRILAYGYHFKNDNFSEQVITDSMPAVLDRVKAEVKAKKDPFAAILQGEDEPWDVAVVELWRHEVERSVGGNIKELNAKGKLFGKED